MTVLLITATVIVTVAAVHALHADHRLDTWNAHVDDALEVTQ